MLHPQTGCWLLLPPPPSPTPLPHPRCPHTPRPLVSLAGMCLHAERGLLEFHTSGVLGFVCFLLVSAAERPGCLWRLLAAPSFLPSFSSLPTLACRRCRNSSLSSFVSGLVSTDHTHTHTHKDPQQDDHIGHLHYGVDQIQTELLLPASPSCFSFSQESLK